jgi:PAS domain S-box-containing protein
MPDSPEALKLLIEASEVLGSSLDYEYRLSSTARLVVKHLADWCAIDIVADGEIHRVAAAHRDPAKEVLAARLLHVRDTRGGARGAVQVIRTGESLLYPEIPEEVLASASEDRERGEVIEALGLKSAIIVPLIARGGVLGAITLVSAESGRRYDARALTLAEDLARRAAVAVENARLYGEAEQAREVMEQQAAELEVHLEELQVQAAQLEETQAEIEGANEELRRANGELFARTVEAERARAEAERANAALQREIEQRTRAEARLRSSERSYRSLFDNLQDLVCIYDLAGRIVNVNDAFLARYGYTREELVGELAAPLFVDPELGNPADAMRSIRAAAEGEPQRFEIWERTKEGTAFPKEVILTRGEYFGATAVISVGRDISTRKEAEAALRESEARYRRLVETSPYGIYALDREGRFTELNPAAEQLLGRPASELLGRRFAEVAAPEDVARVKAVRRRRFAGELKSADSEVHIVNGAGERRLLHVRASVIREGGVIVGTHGTARDITEERAREAEMRLLATALEGLDEGVTVMRFDGQLIYANSTHARLMGYDPETRSLPAVTAFLPDGAEARRLEEIFRVVAEQGAWAGRVRRRRVSDGAVIPVELIVGRVDRTDGESLVFNITRDLTGEIRKEQQLRRVERLASVGTLIGGVAHELNNPLHAIRNFAELLLMEHRGSEDREALEIIQREADRAAKVVSDLRMIARQTQESGAEHEPTDLNDIIRHVLKVRRYALETGNVEMREDLADDLPRVMANRGEIEQVVLNVVVNAEQAMRAQRGDRRLVVRTRPTSEGAAIHVVDNGPGMSPHQLERIFDPFYTTKAPGEGTGLGLSLVHTIISEHGGNVHVESELGKGTAFRIDLPRAPAREAVAAQESAPAAPARPLRVLVVDDEESVRRVSARFLERVGHQVDTAADGAEALQMLKHVRYDAVVADLRMPGLDGEELFHRLRARGDGLERRLVFLTGDAASEQAARLVAAARAPVLVKPVRLAELARTIALTVRGRSPEPEESQ